MSIIERLLRRAGLVRYDLLVEAVRATDEAQDIDPFVTVYGVLTHIDRATGRYTAP